MKVAFDYQVFSMQSYGGVSRYFVQLAKELMLLGQEIDILCPIHRNRYLKELPDQYVHGISFSRFPARTTRIINTFNREISSLRYKKLKSNILHETYYTDRPIKGNIGARILTVYDMIHEKYPEKFAVNDSNSRNKKLSVSRADHIICISQSTKNDLCEIFGVPDEKVSVVHLGFEKFKSTEIGAPVNGSANPFLLYVGNRGGYKNFGNLVKAVASRPQLKNNFEIIAFGGGQFNTDELSLIEGLGYSVGAVRQVGGDDNILGKLYEEASAFVYPSLYEGFGLPPLEAMAHDCPVVTSNTSSMPEVVGPAGEYFSPLDVDAQAEAIINVVFDAQRREDLILQGRMRLNRFSWARCAAETNNVYQDVLQSKRYQ
jgi:glycosyltransferase involved in cell wall biosynthesis